MQIKAKSKFLRFGANFFIIVNIKATVKFLLHKSGYNGWRK